MIKKIVPLRFLSLMFLAFLLSCGASKKKELAPDGFRITAHLQETTDKQMAYLYTQEGELVDSAIATPGGRFNLVGQAKEPTFFVFRLNDSSFVDLLARKGQKIEIIGDARNLSRSYNVDGSPDSKLIQQLYYYYYQVNDRLDSLAHQYKMHQGQSDFDSIKQELDSINAALKTDYRRFISSFIEQHDTSFAALMALGQFYGQTPLLDIDRDIQYFDKVETSLTIRYPNSKQLHKIKRMKQDLREIKLQKQVLSGNLPAPEIALPNPQGDTIRLSDYRDSYVLLWFWASWSPECQRQYHNIMANYYKYHRNGFEVFAVSLDEDKEAWQEAIRKNYLNVIHVSDLKFWESEAAKTYNIRSLPVNYLIDPKGYIIDQNLQGEALGERLFKIYWY